MDPPWLVPEEPPAKEEDAPISTEFQGLDIYKYEFGEPEAQDAFARWLRQQTLPFAWEGSPTEHKVAREDKEPSEIEIVVPDQHVQRAIDVLTATGIFGSPCTKAWSWEDEAKAAKLDVCQHGKLLPHRPIAQAHFDFYRMADGKEVAFPIHIYAKSQIAWELPDPPLVVAENDPNYIASNSIRLPAKAEEGPSGRWLYYPSIAVPRPEKFVETLFFPICRDWRNANAYDIYWRKLLHAMREVRGNPDAVVLKKVGGAFYELWHLFNSGSPEKNNIWRDVDLLKLTLQRVHTFPPPPTFNFFGTAEEARFNGREL